MRRPPQLWEQRLARKTAILGAGISSSGDNTAIVNPTPPPGTDSGVEPAPVLPPPGAFIAPSTPTLISSVQGINVVWNGLNSAGDLWPSDTSYVEVHMSTAGTGFTPDATTLKGRLARPGGLAVTGLAAGGTYHFRLRGADPAGNYTSAGAAATGSPGLITGPDIAANAITANSIVAGTITGWSINAAYLSGGTISGGYVTGGTINGAVITSTTVNGYATTADIAGFITSSDVNSNVTSISGGVITSGTIIGRTVMSASTGKRIVLDAGNNEIQFYNSSGTKTSDLNPATIRSVDGLAVNGALDVGDLLDVTTDLYVGDDVFITGDLEIDGALTGTSTSVPNVRINTTTGVIKETTHANSSQRFKHDIIGLDDTAFGGDIDEQLLGDGAGQVVDPLDVLTLTPIQYRRNEAPNVVVTGFLAEDVEQKFPTAATYDDAGLLETVDERAILAALLAVVKQQAATITDLRARIEALEA